jgi:hypothetical protein
MWRKDFNAPEWIQREKVRIASDEVCPLAAHREFQELVVLWIAASPYARLHVNPFRLACQRCKKRSNLFFAHIAAESLSAQDFVEFGKRGEGNQHSPIAQSFIECVSRF